MFLGIYNNPIGGNNITVLLMMQIFVTVSSFCLFPPSVLSLHLSRREQCVSPEPCSLIWV